LVRFEGNDEELKEKASKNALMLGCGHSFVILLRDAYPINVLNQIKVVPEVCTIHAATANDLEVIVAETEQGRGVLGVIDGQKPLGIEDEEGIRWRKEILRKFGYKT
jgi:adenosine/AMP kinase